MSIHTRVSGSWKPVQSYVRVSGDWKAIPQVWVKKDGTWTTLYTFSWETGSWGDCSVTCGGGTQTRSVKALRSDGTYWSDTIGAMFAGDKPSTSQTCNTGSCTECKAANYKNYTATEIASSSYLEGLSGSFYLSYCYYVTTGDSEQDTRECYTYSRNFWDGQLISSDLYTQHYSLCTEVVDGYMYFGQCYADMGICTCGISYGVVYNGDTTSNGWSLWYVWYLCRSAV